MLSGLYAALRRVYHDHVYGPLCHLWGDLPHTGERVDPRRGGPLVEGHRAVYVFARRYLPERGAVLDLGCGAGYGAEVLADEPEVRYLGVDYERAAVAFAQEHYGSATRRFERLDVGRLVGPAPGPLDAHAPFDLVVANNSMEHFPDALELLPALHALVAPGGRLLICVPPARADGEDDGNRHHVSVHTARTWARHLEALFSRVEAFAHHGAELRAEEQRFAPARPGDLVPGRTYSANLIALR